MLGYYGLLMLWEQNSTTWLKTTELISHISEPRKFRIKVLSLFFSGHFLGHK